jgi:hypothetical protein
MEKEDEKTASRTPDCFGDIETVFPPGKNGLRNSPIACMACVFKTECLRAAMKAREGLVVREEQVDRAYDSGMMGFFERWSRKKTLHRIRQAKSNKDESE